MATNPGQAIGEAVHITPPRYDAARVAFCFTPGEVMAALVAHYRVPLPGSMEQRLKDAPGGFDIPRVVLEVRLIRDDSEYLARARAFEVKQP